jgi:hypothetical protein
MDILRSSLFHAKYCLLILFFYGGKLSSQTVIYEDGIYIATHGYGTYATSSVANVNLDKFGRIYLSSNIYHGIPSSCCDNDVVRINPWSNYHQFVSSGIMGNMPYPNFTSSLYLWNGEYQVFIRKTQNTSLSIPFAPAFQSKVFIDRNDNMFLSNGDSIYKIDSTGVNVSSFDIDVASIAGDEQDNLFIVTDSLRKYNTSGIVLWSYPYNGNMIVADSIGNTYFFDSGNFTKLNSFGNIEFIRPGLPAGLYAIDGLNNIYIADSSNLFKYNMTADTLLWSIPLTETYSAISVDRNQNCYLAKAVNQSNLGAAKLKIVSSLPPPDSILITQISDTVFCSGDSLDVYFDVIGSQNYSNGYKVELSNSAGSFASGITILGYGESSPIKSRILPFTSSSTNYLMRVVPTFYSPGINSLPVQLIINKPATISFSFPNNNLKICSNNPPVNINPQPSGGILSALGFYGTTFYPDSVTAPGNFPFIYSLTDSNGCLVTRAGSISLLLNPVSSVSIITSADSICKGDTLHLTGSPVGGFFGGTGISNNIFYSDSTMMMANLIEYSKVSIVSNFACTTSTSKYIYIYSLDSITFSVPQDTICITAPPFLISAMPTGGVLTGVGIFGNMFYPDSAGPGMSTVYYTVLSNEGCTQQASLNIYVDYCLSIFLDDGEVGLIKIFPNPISDAITIISSQPLINAKIQILELNGHLVYESLFEGLNGNHSVSTLNEGMYLFRIIKNTQQIFNQKISVIKR